MSINVNDNISAGRSENATQESDHVSALSQQSLRIPQFWPHKIVLWLKLLEAQIASTRITKDETKFNVTIANLGEKYIEQVEDIVINPPEDGKYELLKNELVKRLTESDSSRVRKLMENEEIGDRIPSQFFRDLKKLAIPSTPDDFILAIWRTRLPANTQRVLAATTETNATALTEIADRIHEIRPEHGRIAAISRDSKIDEMREELKQLRIQISAIVNHRSRSASRSKQRRPSHSRSVTPQRIRVDDNEMCWYHRRFKNKATKCRSPCNWNWGNE